MLQLLVALYIIRISSLCFTVEGAVKRALLHRLRNDLVPSSHSPQGSAVVSVYWCCCREKNNMPSSAVLRSAFALLSLLIPGLRSQSDCFPADSSFTRAVCVCNGVSGIQCLYRRGLPRLTEFPVLNSTYPLITSIQIQDQQVTELNSSHLEVYPNLTTLIYNGGTLSKISNDAFKNNRKLDGISFTDNRLTAFPPVTNLPLLRDLQLGGNSIQSINPGVLDGCTSLEHLNAEGNDIKELRSGVLSDQSRLHTLNLNNNKRLSTIDPDAFANTAIQRLSLANTAISNLPSSGLRASLDFLDLSDTRNLKRFNAYEPGVEFFNRTYPFLREAKFFYHAHCCQLQDHHTFLRLNTGDPETEPVESTPVVPTEHLPGLVCVNTTNVTTVLDKSSVSTYQNVSVDDFCSSESCVEEVCGERCSRDEEPLGSYFSVSGGGISDIYCLPITPTSCLDKFFDSNSFTSQVTYNTCATEAPTDEVLSTVPTTEPPSCDYYEDWCEYYYPDKVPRCITCALSCNPFVCAVYSGLFDDSCECARKKRSVGETSVLDGHLRSLRSVDLTNGTANNDSCQLRVINVECRERLNETVSVGLPTPTPVFTPAPGAPISGECEYGILEDIGTLLLPEGWFYLESDSHDVICKEVVSSSPTPSPSSSPTLQPPPTAAMYIQDIVTMCSPVPDDFNPCEDLLGDSDVLRAAIWFVIIFAVVGNGAVLFVFFTYAIVIRRTKVKFFPMHFLYANLAGADFLMSIYLLTLASVDINTKGHFSREDIDWRTGPGCGFAGFCAVTSTVVSVYTLVVITTERIYTITFVMHQKKINKLFVLVVMIIGWSLGILIGALPLGGEVNSYELVAVCLPFDTKSSSALAYIVIILLTTGLAFVYIAICYTVIFYQIILSPTKRKLVRTGGRHKQWKGDLRMSMRMFVLVLTNFLCWFPIALVSVTAAFGVPLQGINVATAKIFVVLVFPLNACVNPFLYTLSTRAFKHNFVSLISRCGLLRKSKYTSTYSRQFGLPSSISKRTTDTDVSRRSSVISQLIALNFTMFTNRRTSLETVSENGSHTNLRRPSQASMTSSDEKFLRMHTVLNLRRSSGISQSSTEDISLQEPLPDIPPSSSSVVKDKPRSTQLNSASSLGVLHEVDEVADASSGNALVQQNPGYLDQKHEETFDSCTDTCIHESDHSTCNGTDNVVSSNTADPTTPVVNVLQTDRESPP